MSATMRQGLAALLVAKTVTARKKASALLSNVRKDLRAGATHAQHKLYSDLIVPVDKQLLYAGTLLHKGEASYFDCLDAIRNLEILQAVTRDIGILPNRYTQREQLGNQLKDAEERLKKAGERHNKCEAEERSALDVKAPEKTYYDAPVFGSVLLLLAVLVGYFVVGYTVGNYEAELERRDVYDGTVRLLSFFIWPLFTGIPAVLNVVFKEDFDLILALLRAIFLGFGPAAIIGGLLAIIVATKRITNNARYNAKKARYNKAQQRLKQLGDEQKQLGGERDELTKEIARAKNSLGGVDHEISGYRHRITQKIAELNWK